MARVILEKGKVMKLIRSGNSNILTLTIWGAKKISNAEYPSKCIYDNGNTGSVTFQLPEKSAILISWLRGRNAHVLSFERNNRISFTKHITWLRKKFQRRSRR